MKLYAIALLLVVVAVVHTEAKRSKVRLLGGDDVDKKAAEMLATDKTHADDTPVAPTDLKSIKKLAKVDRVQLKEMQTQARALKTQMADKKKSKSEKKRLRQQFRTLKNTLHTKKNELSNLKREMRAKKQQKLRAHDKMGGAKIKGVTVNPKDRLLMEEEKELNALLPITAKAIVKPTSAAPQTVLATELPPFFKKVSRREKNKKKANKKNRNKNKDSLHMMQSDQPVFPSRGLRKRILCTSDADCHDGSKCLTNKRGRQHCKSAGHGTNKSAGKKCHSSEQCMTGLKCFVTKTAEQTKHKKHPRRGKGVCADPAITDASKGKFLPLRSEIKL